MAVGGTEAQAPPSPVQGLHPSVPLSADKGDKGGVTGWGAPEE